MSEMIDIEKVVKFLTTVPIGYISDALAKLDLVNQGTIGLRPVRGFEDAKIGGPVVTMRYGPIRSGHSPNLSLPLLLADVKPGSIIAVEGGEDTALHGDNQARMAKECGIVGIISSGGTRDLAGLREVGLPIWSQGPAIRSRRSRWELLSFHQPIEVGQVYVEVGDYAFADECGAVFVPKSVLFRVAEVVEAVARAEGQLKALTQLGLSSLQSIVDVYVEKGSRVRM